MQLIRDWMRPNRGPGSLRRRQTRPRRPGMEVRPELRRRQNDGDRADHVTGASVEAEHVNLSSCNAIYWDSSGNAR